MIIPVKGEINKGLSYLITRSIEKAGSLNADTIILEIDTNGGRLDSTEEIMQTLLSCKQRTIAFVNTKAFSAGAYIAVSCDAIYMAPASVIGAATPVSLSPTGNVQETSSSFEEKITSGTVGLIKTAAQHKGHPDNIVSAMVDRDVVIDGIIEKGKLLTLTDTEAKKENIGLSLGTVKNISELLTKENMQEYNQIKYTLTWAEEVSLFLTNSAVSGILMMMGFMALYIEFKTPGFGLGASVAAVCFILFFWGHLIAGLAGVEELILFVIGIILILLEIFVIPGFGITGILGIIAIFVSLVSCNDKTSA